MTTGNCRQIAAGLLAFLWAAAVLAAYYLVHKPFSPPLLISLWPLVSLAGTLALAQALGGCLIRPPRLKFAVWSLKFAVWSLKFAVWSLKFEVRSSESDGGLSPRGRLALQVGLGLGALGLIQLGLAALGVFSPLIGWGGALLAGLWLVRSGRWREWRAALTFHVSRATVPLLLFCALTLGAALLGALAPPTAWDALVYHLTGPKLTLAGGRLAHDLDLPYLGFPQWGEMLFLWGMQMAGDRVPALIHWAFAPLTLMLLPDLLRGIAPGRAWLAAAVLLATPTLSLLAGWPYVEWMLAFAVTASALALFRWRESQDWRWLLLAGALAGLAFGAKYTAAGAILGLALVAAMESARGPGFRRQDAGCRMQDAGGRRQEARFTLYFALFAAAAVFAAGPWLLKNAVLTGNPTYPFFFPGKFWDPLRAYWYARAGTGLPLWRLLLAPWEMTVRGVEGGAGYSATLGPLWLVLLPGLAPGWRGRPAPERRRLAALLLIAGSAYLIWLAGVGWSALLVQSRLLSGVFPLLAALAAAGFEGLAQLSTPRLNLRWLMGAVVALVLLLTAVDTTRALLAENPAGVLSGVVSEGDYLRGKLGWYAVAVERVNALPPDSRVLFLWEPRSYHCAVTCLPDALLDRWWRLRRQGGDAARIAAGWRSEGITHVLVFEAGRASVQAEGFDPFTAADWAELAHLRALELKLVEDFGGAYQLYEVER